MKTMRDRIKQARLAKDMTQAELADAVGVSPQSVQQWETSTEPRKNRVMKIAEILGVDANWLLFGRPESENRKGVVKIELEDDSNVQERYKVEILDIEASAGSGVMVLDDFIETITAIEYSAEEAKRLFGGRTADTVKMITVKGDSMSGTFDPRDQIFVDITVNHFDGDGIYVFILDNQLYIKRLQMQYKKLAVISDNPRYETWYLEDNSIDGMFIQAKVLVSQSIKYKFHG
ncbi:helix-turn-helix domain-containing protein [Providencia alcalifaciens]|nr:S24 family peptidase [Providencia sp. PROV113]ELR5055073.1 helix-turn-helix transcriptional regulator [Providencia rettgeri]MTC27961.1 helix-turn-helix domain-containing protein [Providencia alcalifaciens]ELR5157456.1 helix-turn-helix transcriptional regulator [Providencia rettgeri]ELR5184436.1 helix-turn-helix transcriptional regulator [Providencia rettgeri]ELR5266837.1 helix-turn-helix transcriptional regulator [Providencia rettgeri]